MKKKSKIVRMVKVADKSKGVARVSTGISGFDSLIGGGLVSNSINLVMGNAGAGKTTFLLQFLYNGATKHGENGLYVSFESEVKDLQDAAELRGMSFSKLESDKKCFIIKVEPDVCINELGKKLMEFVVRNNIQRLCFDPINVFALSNKQGNVRKLVYDLVTMFKKLGICVIIAGESEESESISPSEEVVFCKYLVDGVIEIYSSGIGGEGDRALRVSKMRMTNHFRGPVGMKLDDKGISVLSDKSMGKK